MDRRPMPIAALNAGMSGSPVEAIPVGREAGIATGKERSDPGGLFGSFASRIPATIPSATGFALNTWQSAGTYFRPGSSSPRSHLETREALSGGRSPLFNFEYADRIC